MRSLDRGGELDTPAYVESPNPELPAGPHSVSGRGWSGNGGGVLGIINDVIGSPWGFGIMGTADWTKETAQSGHILGGKTGIVYLAGGDIYVANTIQGGGIDVSYYNGSWQTETLQTKSYGGVGIAVNSTNVIHIASVNDTSADLMHTYGTYGSWTTEVVDNTVNYFHTTSAQIGIAINSTDAIFIVAVEDGGGGNNDLRLAKGDGGVWSVKNAISTDTGYPSIAINSTDNLHIAYLWNTVTDQLRHLYGTYDSLTDEQVYAPGRDVGYYDNIAVDSNDDIYISSSGDSTGVGDYLLYVSYYNGSWQTEEVDAVDDTGWYSSIDIDSNDNAHIAYHYATADDLKHANGTWGSWTLEDVDTVGAKGRYCDQAIDLATNTVYISYFDDTNNDLLVAYRSFAGGAPPGSGNCTGNVTYNTPTFPGILESYNLTLNYSQAGNPNADVNITWNSTESDCTLVESVGDIHTWEFTQTIPEVTAYQAVSFHFNASGMNETCNFTATYTQEIYPISIDGCENNTQVVLNTSYYDEVNVTEQLNMTLEANFGIDSIAGVDSDVSFNFSFDPALYHDFCIPSGYNESVIAGVELFYYDVPPDEVQGYAPRYYYLINHDLGVDQVNLSLYSLNTSLAQRFELILYADDYSSLPQHYIQTLRYYVDEMAYRIVEVSRTDDESETLNSMQLDDPYYEFIIIDPDGTVLYTTNPSRMYCTVLPCQKNVFIVDDSDNYRYHERYPDVAYNLTFNASGTDLVSFTYVDPTGQTEFGRLYVYERGIINDTTICNTTTAAASATILCNLSSYTNGSGTFVADIFISRSPEQPFDQLVTTFSQAWRTYGSEGVFWAIMILGVISLTAIWNPSATIAMAVIGLILIRMLGLVFIPWTAITGITIAGAILIWRMS